MNNHEPDGTSESNDIAEEGLQRFIRNREENESESVRTFSIGRKDIWRKVVERGCFQLLFACHISGQKWRHTVGENEGESR